MSRALFVVFLLLPGLALAGPIPREAQQHQRELTRLAQQEFGLSAPVALFASQIHQESSWRSAVESPYAQGLTQFTPATAKWIAEIYPDLGEAAPFSPGWAMRAMLRYNKHLLSRVKPWYARDMPRCDQWAFVLSGYNGGPGWVTRDRRLAESESADPDRWWDQVEFHTARADWARDENRRYPRRILLQLEGRYLRAGWRGRPTCG